MDLIESWCIMERIDGDKLKASISFPDYASARLGSPREQTRDYWVWDSPFRTTTGRTPSFKVYFTYKGGSGYAVDYGGGGASYDIYAFTEALDGVSYKEALQTVAEWAGGNPIASITSRPQAKAPQNQYQFSWDDVNKAELSYPYVKPYIEIKRKISGQIAHESHIGALNWSKVIEYRGKTEKITVNRATLPYYFGGNVHGWVSRRDDLTLIERLNWEFRGLVEETRNKVWLERRKTDPTVGLRDIKDKDVLEAVHQNMWTPEKYRDGFNQIAMLRWHQKGRRSLYNTDRYCTFEGGIYRWKTPIVIIHESEPDALACASVCDNDRVANIAYKIHNDLRTPLWKILGYEPLSVYIAVQNDETSRGLAKSLSERLAYSKENFGLSKYVVDYLHTPIAFKDFSEMNEAGELQSFFQSTIIGSK